MDMIHTKRIGMLVILGVSMLLLATPQPVAASQSATSITINDAYYADLDADALEDDIAILITIQIGDGQKSPSKSDVYYTLTLPSGHQHVALVTVIGKYRQIRLALSWFDAAWESGWYSIRVDALMYGTPGVGYDMDFHIFDPPGTGTGDPTIKVSFW